MASHCRATPATCFHPLSMVSQCPRPSKRCKSVCAGPCEYIAMTSLVTLRGTVWSSVPPDITCQGAKTPMLKTRAAGYRIRDGWRRRSAVADWRRAQAVHFIRAWRQQLHKMTSQLATIERQDPTARNPRAYAMRLEAATLRREIHQAQVLSDRLRSRYQISNGRT